MKSHTQPKSGLFLLALLLLTAFIPQSFAGNYTWTGTTSSAWTTSTNWSPNGNPSTNDTVTITAGGNNCLLSANTTVRKFSLTDDTLDLDSYTLTISTDGS